MKIKKKDNQHIEEEYYKENNEQINKFVNFNDLHALDQIKINIQDLEIIKDQNQ